MLKKLELAIKMMLAKENYHLSWMGYVTTDLNAIWGPQKKQVNQVYVCHFKNLVPEQSILINFNSSNWNP